MLQPDQPPKNLSTFILLFFYCFFFFVLFGFFFVFVWGGWKSTFCLPTMILLIKVLFLLFFLENHWGNECKTWKIWIKHHECVLIVLWVYTAFICWDWYCMRGKKKKAGPTDPVLFFLTLQQRCWLESGDLGSSPTRVSVFCDLWLDLQLPALTWDLTWTCYPWLGTWLGTC